MDVEGVPSWLSSGRYTIDAKTESPQSGAMMRGPMMRALLEERFHLAVHRATREEDVYTMTVAKGGLKAPRTKEGSCIPFDYGEGLGMKPEEVDVSKLCGAPARPSTNGSRTVFDVKGLSFPAFARMLHPNGRSVIDQTGLEGRYDLPFEWDSAIAPSAEPGAAADPSPHATQMEAMQSQLGIRLTPGKGPVEFLVIDRVERPTAN